MYNRNFKSRRGDDGWGMPENKITYAMKSSSWEPDSGAATTGSGAGAGAAAFLPDVAYATPSAAVASVATDS